ncbi:multidrug transporter [Pseudomonas oryzihabitans]|nr:multidrug transporter [Pseudomonas psychrotolerans]KTT29724.1 multidrug transporter [Pseudomonas psychrotolerans]KTT35433.1 multidrug transporter [Pseudomonas psychrotolerans]KTT65042.1 multidrug transporter [Pseudomonas psychrotolerans]KTT71945.1 multidrug transporter [Pseudomonas psychrotolerans]
MSKFFIDRPIFAWVIALVIMLAGILSIINLPINQYPNIAAPAVSIQVTYPGASAQTVQDTVVQVIEQQMNGIDNLRYISSESNSDGSMTIIVTFNQGTNPDIAQVQVQNKLQLATPLLPQEVQQQGMRVAKYQRNFMMVVGLVSMDGSMTKEDLSNYIVSNLRDPLARTSGVGDFQVFGAQYAMRIWLDPEKLVKYQLTPTDVTSAIQSQNVQIASGQLGGLPAVPGQQLNATIIGKTRLTSVEEFGKIFLKVNQDGSQVRLRDVARIELGGENYAIDAQFDGKPASGMALRLATGANALDTAKAVRATIDRLKPFMPAGMEVVYPYDTTPVVTASIHEVVKTLGEAILLVFLVMFLFLQNFRATLIPTIAVPVVLLGTFAVLLAAGFTINILTMFGMVLAIGLLVDDAIVVVENVERVMAEEGLSPKEATRKSMGQIQGALVGIALVLSAVFVPMAFFGGSTGVIYRQFSITIVSSMVLSVLVALILTPALCATLLKPVEKGHHEKRGFFGWFNRTFEKGQHRYERSVAAVVRHKVPFLLIYLAIVAVMAFLFTRVQTSFLPEEDQGVIFVQVTTPPGSSAERTQQVLDTMRETMMKNDPGAISSMFTVNGFNFAGRGQSSGLAFVQLKPWDQRTAANESASAVAGRAMGYLSQIKDAIIYAVVPPAVMELGNATGFDFYLQDQGGVGHEALMAARNQLLGMAAQNPKLSQTRPNGLNDEPQYRLIVDDEKVRALGVSQSDVNQTLSIGWASSYVNDFIDRGRVKKVYVQGEASSRMNPQDFDKWYVRNGSGQMVPVSAFVRGEWTYGSPKLERYNGVSSVEILGSAAPGYSSGDAMAEIERMAKDLPQGVGVAWTGLSYEERLAGSQELYLYMLSILVVFLCLAALYESWSIPVAVILVVPLGVVGAIAATYFRGLGNDVFFKVGLLTTIGLAAKNAILIVEFAKELHEGGKSVVDAAVEAARMRLRPILMTSMAFILGVVPLAISSGASSGSQHAVGTGVIGGMLTATVLAIFWIPMFYVVVSSLFKDQATREQEAHDKEGH